MIKRTLYFGNPVRLRLHLAQLEISPPDVDANTSVRAFAEMQIKRVSIEDIGVIVFDHPHITVSQAVLSALLENNVAVITCDKSRMPVGLLMPLNANSLQAEKFKMQISASQPLCKQLWQQTVKAKILNQSAILRKYGCDFADKLHELANMVKSGDTDNVEAQAASIYWRSLFGFIDGFRRDREGVPPNNLLNYGYAVLRAVVARSLVGSGLLPTLGIHHHNRYNAYCLADDIMEPFRPYVDDLVYDMFISETDLSVLTKQLKARLLSVPVLDVSINNRTHPLMVGVGISTSSLYKCFAAEIRKIAYPIFK